MHKGGFSSVGERVFTCDALTETGLVRHGFSTKRGGVSSGKFASLNLGIYTADAPEMIEQNFSLFCQDIQVNRKSLVFSKQVHSTVVRCVTEEDAGLLPQEYPQCDGLVTNRPGVALATFCADCTPILLLDPVKRVVASIHSGWRGTLGQIVCRGVEVMKSRFGCVPGNILVAMGPSLKQCHFEVDSDVYHLFVEKFGDAAQRNTRQTGEKYYIDTDALNVHSLMSCGVLRENIFVCPLCTHCGEETFFSYRRDGETGRMCGVIELI